jgi:hypothetical protein
MEQFLYRATATACITRSMPVKKKTNSSKAERSRMSPQTKVGCGRRARLKEGGGERKCRRVEGLLVTPSIEVGGVAYHDGGSEDIVAQVVLELIEFDRKCRDDAKRQRLAVEASNLDVFSDQPFDTCFRL